MKKYIFRLRPFLNLIFKMTKVLSKNIIKSLEESIIQFYVINNILFQYIYDVQNLFINFHFVIYDFL
jgi:hypothetical protein